MVVTQEDVQAAEASVAAALAAHQSILEEATVAMQRAQAQIQDLDTHFRQRMQAAWDELKAAEGAENAIRGLLQRDSDPTTTAEVDPKRPIPLTTAK
jgi:hypothetical protein